MIESKLNVVSFLCFNKYDIAFLLIKFQLGDAHPTFCTACPLHSYENVNRVFR